MDCRGFLPTSAGVSIVSESLTPEDEPCAKPSVAEFISDKGVSEAFAVSRRVRMDSSDDSVVALPRSFSSSGDTLSHQEERVRLEDVLITEELAGRSMRPRSF